MTLKDWEVDNDDAADNEEDVWATNNVNGSKPLLALVTKKETTKTMDSISWLFAAVHVNKRSGPRKAKNFQQLNKQVNVVK